MLTTTATKTVASKLNYKGKGKNPQISIGILRNASKSGKRNTSLQDFFFLSSYDDNPRNLPIAETESPAQVKHDPEF